MTTFLFIDYQEIYILICVMVYQYKMKVRYKIIEYVCNLQIAYMLECLVKCYDIFVTLYLK